MDENIVFWDGNPELFKVKDIYYNSVDYFYKDTNKERSKACKTIAQQISISTEILFGKNFNVPKIQESCLLIYIPSVDNHANKIGKKEMQGLASFTKNKNYIYIKQLTGFNGAGSELLKYIIRKALLENSAYSYVEIEAANQDVGLATYYKEIGEKVGNEIRGEVEGYNVKFVKNGINN